MLDIDVNRLDSHPLRYKYSDVLQAAFTIVFRFNFDSTTNYGQIKKKTAHKLVGFGRKHAPMILMGYIVFYCFVCRIIF